MAFIVSTPRLWPRALVPILAALVLFAGFAALGILGATLLTHGVLVVLLAVGAPIIALLTVLGWVVPPAMVVTLPLKVLVGALMVAWDLVDYPLAMGGA